MTNEGSRCVEERALGSAAPPSAPAADAGRPGGELVARGPGGAGRRALLLEARLLVEPGRRERPAQGTQGEPAHGPGQAGRLAGHEVQADADLLELDTPELAAAHRVHRPQRRLLLRRRGPQ